MMKTFRLDKYGFEIEIGKVANQANGSVWFKHGGTVVLATVVSSVSKEFPGFLPLLVDYREQFSAAGKIPGGYFKREGKSSDNEVLTSRLVDRAIRPLFPANFFDQVQILATVYSVDKTHAPNLLALNAASLALSISDIPFLGPVGVVEMCRINGQWVVNPDYPDGKTADARFVIAGTSEGINMVEGSADQVTEKDFVDVLFLAHEHIKEIVAWQQEIKTQVGKPTQEINDFLNWDQWNAAAEEFLTADRIAGVMLSDKVARESYLAEIKDAFFEKHAESVEAEDVPVRAVEYVFEQVLKTKITDCILAKGTRVDGRTSDQIRDIAVEVGMLPFTHGSALFTRGRTQALVTTTLGSSQDEQKTEGLMEETVGDGHFMLHYNFPPFSVGDVRPLRGPGRREVGHGYLAASALRYLLPEKEKFPYTIRIVADMLECDGSTSMATTCGSTMSLMHAGVPLKKMVSGIAMGLLRNSSGEFAVLSDISGFEDAFGLMDFKVTGTQEGITAVQMDIKYKGGLSREVFEVALEQSRKGRLHILREMQKVMDKPQAELSKLVPKLVTVKIPQDKIGAIIGSGGKVIKEIIEKTGTEIDIEPDGLVKIFGGPESDQDAAIMWVKTLAGQIEEGAVFAGKIRRVVEFGLFVELVPGQDGLVHVSNIPRDKQKTFDRDYQVDDQVTVKVVSYDPVTGRIRLRLVESKQA